MRFRENADGTARLSTVEPVVERAVIQKRDDPIGSSKIKPDGIEVRRLGPFQEVKYRGQNVMWTQVPSQVLRMGPKARIVVRPEGFYQEHAPE